MVSAARGPAALRPLLRVLAAPGPGAPGGPCLVWTAVRDAELWAPGVARGPPQAGGVGSGEPGVAAVRRLRLGVAGTVRAEGRRAGVSGARRVSGGGLRGAEAGVAGREPTPESWPARPPLASGRPRWSPAVRCGPVLCSEVAGADAGVRGRGRAGSTGGDRAGSLVLAEPRKPLAAAGEQPSVAGVAEGDPVSSLTFCSEELK